MMYRKSTKCLQHLVDLHETTHASNDVLLLERILEFAGKIALNNKTSSL